MTWPQGRSADGGLDFVPLPEGRAGALWLCGKRVVGPDPLAAMARAEGASTIVSFNEPQDLEHDYPDYLAWLEANNGGTALWWPVPDLHAPSLADARSWVATMLGRLDGGEGLILHCAGGLGRAPTMATCVLIGMGMDADEAGAHVAAHRPMAGPEAGAQHELIAAFARD